MLLYVQFIVAITVQLVCVNVHAQVEETFSAIEDSKEMNVNEVSTGGEIIVKCRPGQKMCTMFGYQYCLHQRLICDGWWHCIDGVDEMDCVCNDNQFACKSGGCVPESKVCDGAGHCKDGSDEEQCVCPENKFRCTKVHQCIFSQQRCDGSVHCFDGTDEQHCVCSEKEFQCANGGCIMIGLKCDGKAHCQDRSDEIDCVCEDDEFMCATGGCVSNRDLCDGFYHCEDGSDERDCSCRPDDDFSCKSGGCVPMRFKCDDRIDCHDASDENECPRKFQNSQIVTFPRRCPPSYPLDFFFNPATELDVFKLRICNPTCVALKDPKAFKGYKGKLQMETDFALEFQFNYKTKLAAPGFLLRHFCTSVEGVSSVSVVYLGEDPYPVSFTRVVDLTVVDSPSTVCTSLLQVHLKTFVVLFHKHASFNKMSISKMKTSFCLRPCEKDNDDDDADIN